MLWMKGWLLRQPLGVMLLLALCWWGLYGQLEWMAAGLVSWLPVTPQTPLFTALSFFFYDVPKILLLLFAVTLVMGVVNTFFTPEKTRALLAGRHEGLGNVLAALLGIVTPFCSCSAVPLFIGFVQAGVPLGVTFSFLIAAPMVNEIALVLLFGLFGWQIALLYLGLGLAVAVIAGWVIGRLRLESQLQDWVQDLRRVEASAETGRLRWGERLLLSLGSVRDIMGRVWLYVVLGIAVGAGIHGYVPQEALAGLMGRDWWSVPLAVLVGVPLYANAAGIIPVVEALMAKGAALGTVLAFMMSVIALSLPELIILRRVLKLRLLMTFVLVVASGILLVGMVFNALL